MLTTKINASAIKAALAGRYGVVPSINDGNAKWDFWCPEDEDEQASREWDEACRAMKMAEATWVNNGCSNSYDPFYLDY